MVAFPTSLDALTNPAAGNRLADTTVLHTTQHANANDAIEALEAKVGINGSADTNSLDYLAKVALPKGVLGYAQTIAAQGGITTEVDLTGLSVSVTVASGRRVEIVGYVRVSSTVADDGIELMVYEGSTRLQSTPITVGAASRPHAITSHVFLTPSAGAHTYKLRLSRFVGGGTVNTDTTTGAPLFIAVMDVGRA